MKKDISYLVFIYFQVINDKIFAHIFPDFMNFMLFVQIFINFLISLLVYKKIFYIIDTFTYLYWRQISILILNVLPCISFKSLYSHWIAPLLFHSWVFRKVLLHSQDYPNIHLIYICILYTKLITLPIENISIDWHRVMIF